MIIYLNGQFVDGRSASVSVWDAGFLFGEGVFTTLRLYRGQAPDLPDHWQRLQQQSSQLEIPFPLGLDQTRRIVANLVQKNNHSTIDTRLRITLTRGGNPEHPLPISPSSASTPTVMLALTPLPSDHDDLNRQGIAAITLGPEYLRGHFPALKSLNYLPSLLALREARNRGCSEAIILSESKVITEGAVSNIFLIQDNEIQTPADDGRILAGRTRSRVLDLAAEKGLICRESALTEKDLNQADEVFLCNSIREVVPIIRINGKPVGPGNPGPLTLQILGWYRQALDSGEST